MHSYGWKVFESWPYGNKRGEKVERRNICWLGVVRRRPQGRTSVSGGGILKELSSYA